MLIIIIMNGITIVDTMNFKWKSSHRSDMFSIIIKHREVP